MNRKLRRKFATSVKGLSLEKAQRAAAYTVSLHCSGPMTEEEMQFALELANGARGEEMYHGGLIGRGVGDELLPPKTTGMDPRGNGDLVGGRKDYVFVTTSFQQASLYAGEVEGVVYRVEPLGVLLADEVQTRAVMLMLEVEPVKSLWSGRLKRSDANRLAIAGCVSAFKCDRARVLEVLK